jgi:hypothetical protein
VGQDKMNVSVFGFANLTAVKAAMSQVGADIAFTLSSTDLVILQKVGISTLTANEFIF